MQKTITRIADNLTLKYLIITWVKKTLHSAGVDSAVFFGLMTRVWGVAAGPITIVIIATFYTSEQQGFYYTFASLLAMQIFFELGLTGVLATFVGHEFSKLHWTEKGGLNGDSIALIRFSDLLGKSITWFGVAACLLVIVLVPTGLFFFGMGSGEPTSFSWKIPWICAVLFVAGNMLAVPFMAFLTGSGEVAAVNKCQVFGAMLGSILSWTIIAIGGGLLAAAAVSCGNFLVNWMYLLQKRPQLLKMAWRNIGWSRNEEEPSVLISWGKDVWPLQWRIALSWISGYFIFQLFTPVLFHYHGAVVAGKMGMTLSVSNALLGISLTMANARNPDFAKLIALRKWIQLDTLFNRTMWQSLVLSVGCSCGAVGIIWLLGTYTSYGSRFIPISQAALLFATVVVQMVTALLSVYLRAHKKEPFMTLSMVAAFLLGCSIWFFGMKYSTSGVVLVYFLISIFFILPWALYIWKRSRAIWHQDAWHG